MENGTSESMGDVQNNVLGEPLKVKKIDDNAIKVKESNVHVIKENRKAKENIIQVANVVANKQINPLPQSDTHTLKRQKISQNSGRRRLNGIGVVQRVAKDQINHEKRKANSRTNVLDSMSHSVDEEFPKLATTLDDCRSMFSSIKEMRTEKDGLTKKLKNVQKRRQSIEREVKSYKLKVEHLKCVSDNQDDLALQIGLFKELAGGRANESD